MCGGCPNFDIARSPPRRVMNRFQPCGIPPTMGYRGSRHAHQTNPTRGSRLRSSYSPSWISKQNIPARASGGRLPKGARTGTVTATQIGAAPSDADPMATSPGRASVHAVVFVALPGAIQVTERAYERLRHSYELRRRGTIEIKSKGHSSQGATQRAPSRTAANHRRYKTFAPVGLSAGQQSTTRRVIAATASRWGSAWSTQSDRQVANVIACPTSARRFLVRCLGGQASRSASIWACAVC